MMATCKDCLHQCYTDNLASTEETCNFFIDKTKDVEQKHGRWVIQRYYGGIRRGIATRIVCSSK